MPSHVLSVLMTAAVALSGVGCGTRVFNDDFTTDAVGAPPVSPPAGDPVDDSLTVQGPAGSVVVIDAVPHGSKAAKMERAGTPPQVVLECVTGGGPNVDGNYFISYRAYSPIIATPRLTTVVKSSQGQRAFELSATGGEFRLSSGDAVDAVVGGGYLANTVHAIEVRIDLSAAKFWLSIGGTEVASDKPFLDAGFSEVHSLRFEYPAPLLEALPASYVIDDVVIRK
jgi:hypothetical protein